MKNQSITYLVGLFVMNVVSSGPPCGLLGKSLRSIYYKTTTLLHRSLKNNLVRQGAPGHLRRLLGIPFRTHGST